MEKESQRAGDGRGHSEHALRGYGSSEFHPDAARGSGSSERDPCNQSRVAAIALITLLLLIIVLVTSTVDRRFFLKTLEIRRGEQRYRQIVEAAFDAFLGFDSSLRIEHWNAQAEATFGWMRSEAKGRLVDDFILLDQSNEEAKGTLRGLLFRDNTFAMHTALASRRRSSKACSSHSARQIPPQRECMEAQASDSPSPACLWK